MLPGTFFTDDGRACRLVDGKVRKGGQAVVYRAELDGQPVAVKVYESDLSRVPLERRILEDIQRGDPTAAEWLVTFLGGGTVMDRPFLVLPWMETTLSEWIPNEPLAARVHVLLDAARCVARLHASRRTEAGYRVHRDIKPDNLLLRHEGRWVVRLADLGAAKDGDVRSDTTNTGVLTEKFAPPEQALPINQEPRESWDAHALAVTVFWGLTERIPIPALDAPSALNADGRELVRLARRGAHSTMNADEEARFVQLRARRAEELLDLDGVGSWREDDTAHLRRALEDLELADEVRNQLLDTLIGALRGALEPDPRRRDDTVDHLVSALELWACALPFSDADAKARAPTVMMPGRRAGPVPSVPRQPSGGAEQRVRRRWWILLGAGIGVATSALSLLATRGGGGPEQTLASLNEGVSPNTATVPPPAAPVPAPAPPSPPVVGPTSPVASLVAARPATRKPQARPEPPAVASATAPVVVVASPVAGDPAPAAPATLSVRVRACPAEGASVSVDGGAPRALSGLALAVDLSPGPHAFTWQFGEERHERTLDVTASRGACHAFTVDRACGRCDD